MFSRNNRLLSETTNVNNVDVATAPFTIEFKPNVSHVMTMVHVYT